MGYQTPYKGSYPGRTTASITDIKAQFYNEYGLDRIRQHVIVPSAELNVLAGDPLIWISKASNTARPIKFGVMTGATTTTLTLTATHKARFAVGDLVWAYHGEHKEYLGPIVSIHATNQTMVVSEAPSFTAGFIFCMAPGDILSGTSSAAGLEKGADTSDTGLYYITLGAGEANHFKIGDFVYEDATGGAGAAIKNLGPVVKVDIPNAKIFVHTEPAITTGGVIGGNGKFPEILGIAYWDQPTTYPDDTTADATVTYLLESVLLRSKMGRFTDAVDDELLKFMAESAPMITVTSQKDFVGGN